MERRGALGVEPYRAERRASCTSNRASAATSTYEHAVSSRGASLCSACSVARATLTVTSCQLLLQPSTSRRRGSAATSRRASGSCGFCGWRPSQIARPRFPTGTSAPTPCILDAFRPSRSCASSRVRWCAARVAPSAARAFPLAAMSCASRGWIALISSVPSSLRRPWSSAGGGEEQRIGRGRDVCERAGKAGGGDEKAARCVNAGWLGFGRDAAQLFEGLLGLPGVQGGSSREREQERGGSGSVHGPNIGEKQATAGQQQLDGCQSQSFERKGERARAMDSSGGKVVGSALRQNRVVAGGRASERGGARRRRLSLANHHTHRTGA